VSEVEIAAPPIFPSSGSAIAILFMETSESYVVGLFDWQFFGTLTFKSERLPEAIRISLYFALLRQFCRRFRMKFPYLLWVLRQEEGDAWGRRHFHFLLAGVHESLVTQATCSWLTNEWIKLGGGIADIDVFDRRLNARSYILKRSGLYKGIPFDDRESAKFGSKACELMFAKRIWKVAKMRPGYERARLAHGR
jgi:hypothetical protein